MSFRNAGVRGGGRLIAGAGRGAGVADIAAGIDLSASASAARAPVAADPKAVKVGILGAEAGDGAPITL